MSFVCEHCKEPQNYVSSLQSCYTCAGWLQLIQHRHQPTSARIDGEYFTVGSPTVEKPIFTILFHDGRTLSTDHLWPHGPIPELFRSDLPDNAKFKSLAP